MSSETLKQEIRRTAAQNAEKVLADAKAEAARILAEAESQARAITERRVNESQKLLDQGERSEVAKARVEGARNLSTAEARVVEDAFREAESRVSSLPSSDPGRYKSVLTRFIEEAREQLGGATLVVVARGQDRELVNEVLRGLPRGGDLPECTMSADSLEARGGVIVHTEDMRVYYVNTFDSRLRRAREELRAKVVAAMFEGGR